MSDAAESVFLGEDWILYVGAPGDFERSEMIAPCLILSQPGTTFQLSPDRCPPLVAPFILHRSGHWSCGAGPAVALLYVDALSREGLIIQQTALPASTSLLWLAPEAHTPAAFDTLLLANDAKHFARDYVAAWRSALRASLPTAPEIDPRLHRIAAMIAASPDGRLTLSPLSATVDICSDHLRQQFKRVCGMTLSRYQMWQRLRSMVRHACDDYATAGVVTAEGMIHAAGFYDTPHGSRAIRRYFGMPASSAAGKGIRFTDCRLSA